MGYKSAVTGAVSRPVVSLPTPPKSLKAQGKKLWKRVQEAFELEDYQLETLRLACECLDRIGPRREEIIRREKGGHLYYGRPGVYCCRQCWEEYYESQARYLRCLGLLTPQEAQIVPVDLDECDEWRLEEYEDCGDPSMHREQLQEFLTRQHGHYAQVWEP
jgi:hypothetical protein